MCSVFFASEDSLVDYEMAAAVLRGRHSVALFHVYSADSLTVRAYNFVLAGLRGNLARSQLVHALIPPYP